VISPNIVATRLRIGSARCQTRAGRIDSDVTPHTAMARDGRILRTLSHSATQGTQALQARTAPHSPHYSRRLRHATCQSTRDTRYTASRLQVGTASPTGRPQALSADRFVRLDLLCHSIQQDNACAAATTAPVREAPTSGLLRTPFARPCDSALACIHLASLALRARPRRRGRTCRRGRRASTVAVTPPTPAASGGFGTRSRASRV
jgi:hypothetical protein